ncbi:hypothetical protein EYC84_011049 [Monilinia fructicola]|uniref:Uncharacterized protein n=1 Tax=Monilinia fructicola TaxID=38448 RepID=A0A5M9JAG6_MONFR|nr:hypothetical protein EYC84_011049 [Monilinia fructicola]
MIINEKDMISSHLATRNDSASLCEVHTTLPKTNPDQSQDPHTYTQLSSSFPYNRDATPTPTPKTLRAPLNTK